MHLVFLPESFALSRRFLTFRLEAQREAGRLAGRDVQGSAGDKAGADGGLVHRPRGAPRGPQQSDDPQFREPPAPPGQHRPSCISVSLRKRNLISMRRVLVLIELFCRWAVFAHTRTALGRTTTLPSLSRTQPVSSFVITYDR